MIVSRQDLPKPKPFDGPFATQKPFAPRGGVLKALSCFAGSTAAKANLDALARGKARVVITGQQPSFPQPLGLTLQKVATAIALTKRESDLVPVFWNGSDDSDFLEAAGQLLPREGQTPLEVSLPRNLDQKGKRVGELPVEKAFADLLRFVKPAFLPHNRENLGDFHARVMAEVFASEGLLVLDARSPAIMESAVPLLTRYAKVRRELSHRVDQMGDLLETEFEARPLRRGIAERALFFLKDGRRRLPVLDDYAEALQGRISDPGGRLSPNVVMRPLIQDFVLPVESVVLGPSEWIYHHQILPVFEILDQPFPRPWPRLDAAGAWELKRESPPAGGRRHSPLLEQQKSLAQSDILLQLAQLHLEAWGENHYHRWILDGEDLL